MQAVGDRIKTIRKKAGLTQRELAKKLGKSERMVRRYENGTIDFPYSVLRDIADALDVSVVALLTDTGNYH